MAGVRFGMETLQRTRIGPAELAGVALLLVLFAARPAGAQSRVNDGGNFFSKDVAAKVAADLDGLATARGVSVIVETFDAAPAPLADQLKSADDSAKRAAYVAYGKARAAELNADYYLFATRQPPQVRTQTMAKAHAQGLSVSEEDQITTAVVEGFRKRDFDRGLTDAVATLKSALAGNLPVVASNARPSAPAAAGRSADPVVPAEPSQRSGASMLLPLLILGGLILIGVVVIRALVGAARRSSMNQMPPPLPGQPGYGQPGYGYGQPGYGVGSGGFGRGLMGGLLGGIAGGYLANRAFGQGHDNSSTNDSDAGTHGGGAFADTGPSDAGNIDYGDSGGGDFGGDMGDAGGGDFSGGDSGGGDF